MRVRNETIYNEKKARIMEACFNCYAENGLHGTGLSALAKAAGISKAAIYTYFEDADALIIESTEYCMSKVEDEFMNKAPTDPQDVKRSAHTCLYIDQQMAGVGGVDSWSGNAEALRPYRVDAKNRTFTFYIKRR